MNSFGNKFKLTIFGESHGPAIGVVVDGVAPGIGLTADDFTADLSRRKSGGKGTTARKEDDIPEIISGVFNGMTTGAPVTVIFRNNNVSPADYTAFADHPRPSHADWVASMKYGGYHDYRGGGHFSGRMTLALVAAGVIAKKTLLPGIQINGKILEIGDCRDTDRFNEIIENATIEKDSVGAVVECTAVNVPAGKGEPFFDSVESVLSHLLFSIPGIKGVEFGSGFMASTMKGSQHNDSIISVCGKTETNNSGGINAGITNGNPLVVRVAVKPTPSIGKEQESINLKSGEIESLTIKGRHDVCFALRVPVIVEAAVAITLAQF